MVVISDKFFPTRVCGVDECVSSFHKVGRGIGFCEMEEEGEGSACEDTALEISRVKVSSARE